MPPVTWTERLARLRSIASAAAAPDAGAAEQGAAALRRIRVAALVAILLLGAGGLTGRASDSHSSVPATDPPTPTPAYRIYVPLASLGAAPEPITLTLAAAPTAWQAESAGLDYAAVVQGTAWLVTYDQGVPAVGQNATAGDRMYRANKAFLFFDTSAIPAHATVLSATLTAANCRQVAGVPFTVAFYGTAAPLPPAPADWLNYGGPVLGTLPSAECGVWNAPISITVALDPASIVKGGLTAYALTTDRLAAALAPAWGAADKLIFDCYADDALVVRYVIPPQREVLP